jgi:hypothetical protein
LRSKSPDAFLRSRTRKDRIESLGMAFYKKTYCSPSRCKRWDQPALQTNGELCLLHWMTRHHSISITRLATRSFSSASATVACYPQTYRCILSFSARFGISMFGLRYDFTASHSCFAFAGHRVNHHTALAEQRRDVICACQGHSSVVVTLTKAHARNPRV